MINKIFIKSEPYFFIADKEERFLVSCNYIRDDDGNIAQMTFDEAKKYAPTRTHYRALIKEKDGVESVLSVHTSNGKKNVGYDQLSDEWTSSEFNDCFGYYFRCWHTEEYCGIYTNVKDYKLPCRRVIADKEIVEREIKKYNQKMHAQRFNKTKKRKID